MHKKLGPQGLITMSVSVTEKKLSQEKILAFLQKQDARFTNLILDEPLDFWTEKFSPNRPFLYVFNRNGQWRRFDATDLAEEDADAKIEKLILEWLKEK
jgi:hypothetical protein